MSDNPLEKSALVICLENLRRMDHDRFLTVLIAPAGAQAKLTALYAFNAEIARVREMVSEPMLGQIRLQWWREAIEALGKGDVRGHEAAVALSQSFADGSLDEAALIALIDARERDLSDEPFEDMAALEDYCISTSSSLMVIAANTIAPDAAKAGAAMIRHAGIAYALTGLLRALPMHASQGRLYLPLALLRNYDVDPHQIFAGEKSEGLRAIIGEMAKTARAHLAKARALQASALKPIYPALRPASLCDAYLAQVTTADFNPFKQAVDASPLRQQLRLLGRKFTGRF